MKIDKFVMSATNKKNVIEIIRTKGPIHKAEISRLLGLSLPTVMKFTDELEVSGAVKVIGKAESSGGKCPELLEFVSDAFYIVGVDVGRNAMKAVVMDLGGNITGKAIVKTGDDVNPEVTVARLIELIKTVIRKSKVPFDKLLGMGIGMPGILDAENGNVIFSPDFNWENIPLLEPLKKHFNLSQILINSNQAMAMGERWFGAGKQSDYFICINLGHGIGSAIVEKGEIYYGSCGSSGEVGHMTLEKDGPVCECGNHGCLEILASGNAIALQAQQAVHDGEESAMSQMANGQNSQIDAKIVFDAARENDKTAAQIINTAVEYIGIGIANYINLLDPDMIIINGGIVNAGDILLERLIPVIKERQMKFAGRKVKIKIGALGENATSMGAAAMILKEYINAGCNGKGIYRQTASHV